MLTTVDRIVAKIICVLFVVPVSLCVGYWSQYYSTAPDFAGLMLFLGIVSAVAGFACWTLTND